jgi:hypothetical protein
MTRRLDVRRPALPVANRKRLEVRRLPLTVMTRRLDVRRPALPVANRRRLEVRRLPYL